MSGNLNKVKLIGNLGKDPEIRTLQNGGRVANLMVATSESWKDKATGERKEKTEWHRVVILNNGLVEVAANYLKKGQKFISRDSSRHGNGTTAVRTDTRPRSCCVLTMVT